MSSVYLNHSVACVDRRNLVFAGNLMLYGRNRATQALVTHARTLIEEALAPYPAEQAQTALSVDEFIARVGPLKSRFTNDQRTKELVRDVLTEFGCNLADTWFDVPRLRVVPHSGYLSSGVSYAYRAHRDTWYSSPQVQVNWWMPVYAVTPERTMSFFPDYFDQAVPNSSAEFDYGEWCAVGRKLATSQVGEDTRKHPLPLGPIDTRAELRIAGTPGDMLVFSAAHLHSTAPNTSGATRFSIDFRTLHRADLESGRGAPNVDGDARGSTVSDFLLASDFSPIDPSWVSAVRTEARHEHAV